jgi:flagellar hook protein FlgE
MHMPSLYCGWSGVAAHTTAISSVADNLANESTTGFKGTRALFHDIMSTAIYDGNKDVQEQGNGVYVGAQNLMTQGSIIDTDNPLDMAINGEGFFAVKKPVNASPGGPATGSIGDNFYTRAGEFRLDANGFLVNSEGYVVQGFAAGADGTVAAGALADIQINQDMYIAGTATSNVDVTMNLDASDTSTHAQAQAIDPTDNSTYNYSYTVPFYDAQGNSHNITTYYQRLDAYAGPTPAGSSSVWRAASFENDNGTVTANPTSPSNIYYLHFDTNGHLVGTSQAIPATGDSYIYSPALSGVGASASDRIGEELTYTGAGVAQTFRTNGSATFSGATAGGETVSVGGDVYTLPATASAAGAANWLAEQINSDPTRAYFAQASAGVVTIYAEGAASLDLASTGATVTTNDNTTLNQVVNSVDNGLAAQGALDLTNLGLGDSVTVAGTTFTEGVDFTDAATLAAAINGAGLGVTASDNGGFGVFLSASAVGTAGNAITLASTGGVVASGATLVGGLDDSATTLVDATALFNITTGERYLCLRRSDTGAAATLTLGTTNTLGAGLGLDFNTASQASVATDAVNTAETEGQVQLAYLFGTATQDVTWDFTPTSTSATTQSAGTSSTSYVYQNGLGGGTLESLSVDRWGDIYGHFSNSQDVILAGVGLSNFKSPSELKRVGDTLWQATPEAGLVVIGLPGGVEGMGLIQGAALESANIDLATEFTNMINYQRAYQANTKSITTSDEMLKEAINLKR